MRMTADSNDVLEVIQRYSNRPSVKDALTQLFGDLPVDKNALDLSNVKTMDLTKVWRNAGLNELIQVRGSGNYNQKGFYLNPDYRWNIVQDNEGYFTLVCSQ